MKLTAHERAVRFFRSNAGYSYDPKTETPLDGRTRNARALAWAERHASDDGCSFEWALDDITSAEFSDDPDPWPLWVCIARDSQGKVFASLGGVDFGRDGEPWGQSYRRVVEAELAMERPVED